MQSVSLVEARIIDYLRDGMRCDPYDCGTVLEEIRHLARVGGYTLGPRFAQSGLGSGPEARVAASIVARALGMSGTETTEYTLRTHVDSWLRRRPQKGKF